ncbi:hypothetical protein [Sphingobium sp. YBL2]|uniref:hypothetical protein n=1 Tax=Sphingobium sp. (strain YBL2) TaxID=484429 RepID=UPI0005CBA898|nr:hypothetical protein [Sphingobium sp. YBL2]AJR24571.1 hypothetical protein TZ53_13415 [Sphingobium sp. YBL2]
MTSIDMIPIERASRAIIDAAQEQGAYVGGEPDNLRSVPINGVIDAKAMVRAVLAAIREPSEAMIYASSEGGLGFNDKVIEDWQSMIDAMLDEGDEKPAGT